MNIRSILSLAFLMLWIGTSSANHTSLPISEKTNVVLAYGDDIIGNMEDASGEEIYIFSGSEGDKIILRLYSDLNLTLELLDSTGNILADDNELNSINRIDVSLPHTGTFTIVIKCSSGENTGIYGLSLEKINSALTTPIMECNSSFSDSIVSLAAINNYSFHGVIGDHILLQINSEDTLFESRLELYDPEGNLVELEISSGNLARIGILELNQEGNYSLLIMESGGNHIGNYSLSFQVLQASCMTVLNCSDNITEEIYQLAEFKAYVFDASQGDQLILRMKGLSSFFDARMELYDPEFNLLELEVSNGNLIRIGAMELLVSGTYTILVMDEDGDETGTYGLSLQVLTGDCSSLLSCNHSLSNTLSVNTEIHAYTFEANEGEDLIVQASGESGFFDMRMELYAPDLELVELEVGNGGQARIGAIKAPTTGSYTLLIMEENADFTGEYGLSLQFLRPDCIESISCDASFSDLIGSYAQMKAYEFEAQTDDHFIIQMKGQSPSFDTRMELYDPDRELIDIEIGIGSLARIGATRMEKSGSYILVVSERGGNFSGSFGLSLQKLSPECSTMLCNNSVNASFENKAQIDAYTFQGNEGTSAIIECSDLSSGLSPLIELYAPDFTLLESVSDSNQAIISTDLNQTGLYTILAFDQDGDNFGNYFLELQGCNLTSTNEPEANYNFTNYPNPFDKETTFSFDISKSKNIKLEIYHSNLQKIRTLSDQEFHSGNHKVTWNTDQLPTGVYWCIFQSDNFVIVRKLILSH